MDKKENVCNGSTSEGLAKVIRARRGDQGNDEELVPLAISSSDDSDNMEEETGTNKDDVFATPPVSPARNGHLSNGDIYKQKAVVKDADDVSDTRCGYYTCQPDILQKCNNPKALLCFLCCFSMAQGFVVNGINNVSTTSVERRFQLPSSRVGMVSSSYDLSAAILGVFISFLGSGRQKARWLAAACVVMSVGSFVMALPHFTSGHYEWGQDVALTCSNEESRTSCGGNDSDLQHYLYVLILGQLLHGVGGTTLYTVGVSLIDDSVSARSFPLYIGILYAFATLGPAMGYIVGGQLLDIYVDFDTVPSSDVRITPDDPRWVGAWWVGFLIASVLFLVAAIPISAYGSELPSAKHVRETRVSEMHGGDGSVQASTVSAQNRKFSDLKYLPAGMWQLLKTPPFVFITFAGATEGVVISGFATFMPKFIQNQFGVTAGWASMLTGFMAVPSAAGGQFFGGFLCNRLRLKVKGCLRIGIICCTLALFISGGIWARCGLGEFSGVTRSYPNSSAPGPPSLIAECNERCHCHTELYEPVCDQHGIQYFSPCHAGCETTDDGKLFRNCSCVQPMPGTNVSTVTVNKCDQGCTTLYWFLIFAFLTIFLMFVPSPPGVSATLRCIHDSQRTLGLGLKYCIVRLFGTVPGPIIFGAIIDSTCMIWREKCGEHASCWIYDNNLMSRNFFILLICFKIASIIFFTMAHQLYTPPKEKDVQFVVTKDPRNCESVSSTVTILPNSPK